MGLIDVDKVLAELTLHEKIELLSGHDTWRTNAIERLNIPAITTTDGPHGARGTSFFNGPPGMLLPSATAMGATFDRKLMLSVGRMLGRETREKGCQVLLAPTVCLQRSPLIGRGFEAFGEDPWLSGTLASDYVNGVQSESVACAIKHYAAHDQSTMSQEDSIWASERTLRELHLLPFQIAAKQANPWSIMTSYHKINGIHTAEHPWLINQVLREDWGWDGLVMSDWFGTYSTTEALDAGLDLEMPGPTRWRGQLLFWAVISKKLKQATLNAAVRNYLNLLNRVQPALEQQVDQSTAGDSPEKRELCRKVAAESIVLLKNEHGILPLDAKRPGTKYALIGPGVLYPAVSGGGSSDLMPYYISKPLDALNELVGAENVTSNIGCYGHLFTPCLSSCITVPGSTQKGFCVEYFMQEPDMAKEIKPLVTTTTTQAQMFFADNLPDGISEGYWVRVTTTYTAEATRPIQIGLCVAGKGRLYINGVEKIDLFSSHPEKTLKTPMFDQYSMEVTTVLDAQKGQSYEIMVLLQNESLTPSVGALSSGGLRIGCCEHFDPAAKLAEATALARTVDYPIVIAGLNSDWESEAMDRKSLALAPQVDNLIEAVIRANPNTIVVTQAGCPITLPWVDSAKTLVHAWYGGQETGNAIMDVLFGKINPSGRLSVTFPKRLEDTPAFLSFGKQDKMLHYGEGVFIGHRYYEKLKTPPLFYFGYGLSYTTFAYRDLKVPQTVDLAARPTFDVSVTLQNTGTRDGAEIVQVYVADLESSVQRPVKELKGYQKVYVAVGETVDVSVTLDKYALSFWSQDHEQWLAEQGAFEIVVATSADPEDEVLRQRFELADDYLWSGM
ncbi:glycoside hydrolase superfamily [Aspergillus pseudodeflectus]|uniref:beta-glucosidase n=1 Tax=Aspergillus pseudodeflectus TaxID=176178 RepID=A0ABR4JQI1_9EURO